MNRTALDEHLAVAQHGGIGEVHGQLRVVAIDDAAEEERADRAEPDGEAGEEPRVLVVESELTFPPLLEVSKAIEDREGVATLEDVRAIVNARRCRQDVELVLYLDDFFDHARHSSDPDLTARATRRS